MSPKKTAGAGADRASAHEREQRVAAAQARRNAGFAKAKVGDDLPVQLEEQEEDQKQPTMFDMLVRHKYVGIPLRIVQARLEAKRRRKEMEEAREAKRIWDMMMLLEPGMRVKLVHVGRVGGVKYDGKIATVIADGVRPRDRQRERERETVWQASGKGLSGRKVEAFWKHAER